MANNFGQDDGFFQGSYNSQGQGYDMPYSQPQAQTGAGGADFGNFDYSQNSGGAYNAGQYDQAQPAYVPAQSGYTGNIMTPDQSAFQQPTSDEEDYENEPPLLEELGK